MAVVTISSRFAATPAIARDVATIAMKNRRPILTTAGVLVPNMTAFSFADISYLLFGCLCVPGVKAKFLLLLTT